MGSAESETNPKLSHIETIDRLVTSVLEKSALGLVDADIYRLQRQLLQAGYTCLATADYCGTSFSIEENPYSLQEGIYHLNEIPRIVNESDVDVPEGKDLVREELLEQLEEFDRLQKEIVGSAKLLNGIDPGPSESSIYNLRELLLLAGYTDLAISDFCSSGFTPRPNNRYGLGENTHRFIEIAKIVEAYPAGFLLRKDNLRERILGELKRFKEIKERLHQQGKFGFSFSNWSWHKWKDDEEQFRVYLNPRDSRQYNFGRFNLCELEEWTRDEGPVLAPRRTIITAFGGIPGMPDGSELKPVRIVKDFQVEGFRLSGLDVDIYTAPVQAFIGEDNSVLMGQIEVDSLYRLVGTRQKRLFSTTVDVCHGRKSEKQGVGDFFVIIQVRLKSGLSISTIEVADGLSVGESDQDWTMISKNLHSLVPDSLKQLLTNIEHCSPDVLFNIVSRIFYSSSNLEFRDWLRSLCAFDQEVSWDKGSKYPHSAELQGKVNRKLVELIRLRSAHRNSITDHIVRSLATRGISATLQPMHANAIAGYNLLIHMPFQGPGTIPAIDRKKYNGLTIATLSRSTADTMLFFNVSGEVDTALPYRSGVLVVDSNRLLDDLFGRMVDEFGRETANEFYTKYIYPGKVGEGFSVFSTIGQLGQSLNPTDNEISALVQQYGIQIAHRQDGKSSLHVVTGTDGAYTSRDPGERAEVEKEFRHAVELYTADRGQFIREKLKRGCDDDYTIVNLQVNVE